MHASAPSQNSRQSKSSLKRIHHRHLLQFANVTLSPFSIFHTTSRPGLGLTETPLSHLCRAWFALACALILYSVVRSALLVPITPSFSVACIGRKNAWACCTASCLQAASSCALGCRMGLVVCVAPTPHPNLASPCACVRRYFFMQQKK